MICVFLCVLVYAFMHFYLYFYVYMGQVPEINTDDDENRTGKCLKAIQALKDNVKKKKRNAKGRRTKESICLLHFLSMSWHD